MPKLKLAVISDIHLGHRNNPARRIIANLKAAFPDNQETAELDLIVLAGDTYDHLLSLPDHESAEIDIWITYMLWLCERHQIKLRVLEGTATHDYGQPSRFCVMAEALDSKADYRYVNDIEVENIPDLGINVLYVPDDMGKADTTLAVVREKISAMGLSQVDFAFMHGQFEYQLPPHVHANRHDSVAYSELVRHYVFIGHIHVYSHHLNIVAQGSFDRISHGEEGPKGHARCEIGLDGTKSVEFVVNKGAMLFKTIDCTGLGLEETLERVDALAATLPRDSRVRVRISPDHPLKRNFSELHSRHPFLYFDEQVVKPDAPVLEVAAIEPEYVPIEITKSNVLSLVSERLSAGGSLSAAAIGALKLLEELR